MSAEAFVARLKCKLELRDQGHVALEDLLGPQRDIGPAVRTGMLRQTQRCCALQRYERHLPSRKGARYLEYVAEHHLIVVRAERVRAFEEEIARDPEPNAVFVPPHDPLPFGLEPAPPARPVKRTDFDLFAELARLREDERRCWLREGYVDFEEFRELNQVPDHALLASGLFRAHDARKDVHALPLVPHGKGEHYMLLVAAWDLLFIKSDMARPLFLLIDRTRCREWLAAVERG